MIVQNKNADMMAPPKIQMKNNYYYSEMMKTMKRKKKKQIFMTTFKKHTHTTTKQTPPMLRIKKIIRQIHERKNYFDKRNKTTRKMKSKMIKPKTTHLCCSNYKSL